VVSRSDAEIASGYLAVQIHSHMAINIDRHASQP